MMEITTETPQLFRGCTSHWPAGKLWTNDLRVCKPMDDFIIVLIPTQGGVCIHPHALKCLFTQFFVQAENGDKQAICAALLRRKIWIVTSWFLVHGCLLTRDMHRYKSSHMHPHHAQPLLHSHVALLCNLFQVFKLHWRFDPARTSLSLSFKIIDL